MMHGHTYIKFVSILMCSCHDWFYSARALHSELQLQVKYIIFVYYYTVVKWPSEEF